MRRRGGRGGQVVVEMLLILPVFLTIVFTIMEIGYVSFRLIVLNHMTYEIARIGGMKCKPGGGCDMSTWMKSMFHNDQTIAVVCRPEATLMDPQAQQQNYDLVCTSHEDVHLIFMPLTFFLAKPPGHGTRELSATVRMPIEQPLKN